MPAKGQIAPAIAARFPLFEAAPANALLESGQVVGNIVLLAPELPAQETGMIRPDGSWLFTRLLGNEATRVLAGVTLAGLFFPDALYPTQTPRRTLISNDAVNVFIGLPILLGSAWLARTGSLLGLLAWPGALFYVLYNASAHAGAYAVAMPLTAPFIAYVTLVILSAFTIARLVLGLEATAVRRALAGGVPARLGGGVLIGLGALFFLRAIGQWVSGQVALAEPEVAVLVADLVTTPFWVIGGVLLWRRQALGYAVGLGLLFQASLG